MSPTDGIDPALLVHDPESTFDESIDSDLMARPETQPLALCKQFLRLVFRYLPHEVPKPIPTELVYALNWVERVPDRACLPVPFDLAVSLPQSPDAWIGLLRGLSNSVYGHLSRNDQGDAALKVYKRSYFELLEVSGLLDAFTMVGTLLPPRVVDQETLAPFDRDQLMTILQWYARSLDQLFRQLGARTAQLTGTQRELARARLRLSREKREKKE